MHNRRINPIAKSKKARHARHFCSQSEVQKVQAARTSVAEDKVENIEILGAEYVAMAAAAIAVAVHDGRRRRAAYAQETQHQAPEAA